MGINYDALKFWFDVGQFSATILLGVYVWLSNRQRVTIDKIKNLEQKLDGRHERQQDSCAMHKNRTTTLEVNMQHLPSASAVSKLVSTVSDLTGQLSGLKRAVDLLVQYHMKGEKGGTD